MATSSSTRPDLMKVLLHPLGSASANLHVNRHTQLILAVLYYKIRKAVFWPRRSCEGCEGIRNPPRARRNIICPIGINDAKVYRIVPAIVDPSFGSQHDAQEWQASMQALLLVADTRRERCEEPQLDSVSV
jgi:hypothetical protein